LKLETRKKIYNIILKHPGLHLRELSRKTDISFGGLRHHLKYLKKNGYLTIKVDRRYTRYYAVKEVGKKDKELMNLMRQDIPRKIIMLLLCEGPPELYGKFSKEEISDPSLRTFVHSKKELANLTKYWRKPYDLDFNINKKRQTIDFHLKKLIEADLVEKVKEGRETKYQLKDRFRVWLFLAKYKDALSDNLVDNMVSWSFDVIERKVDAVSNVIWEIFPHPYHA
jgi:predicted transcriptional regulator